MKDNYKIYLTIVQVQSTSPSTKELQSIERVNIGEVIAWTVNTRDLFNIGFEGQEGQPIIKVIESGVIINVWFKPMAPLHY